MIALKILLAVAVGVGVYIVDIAFAGLALVLLGVWEPFAFVTSIGNLIIGVWVIVFLSRRALRGEPMFRSI